MLIPSAPPRFAPPLFALPRRSRWSDARQGAAALLRAVLFQLAGGIALLGLLVLAYMAKRALGLDIVPGVDMLPDTEIEAALRSAADLFGG